MAGNLWIAEAHAHSLEPDPAFYAVLFANLADTPPGADLCLEADEASEVLSSELALPSSLSFDPAGNAYLTVNGTGKSGSNVAVRIPMLTDLIAELVPQAKTGYGDR